MVSVFRQLRSEARYKPITQLAPQTQQRMVETVKESGLAEGIELRFHPKYQWGAFVSAGKTIHRRTMIGMYTGRYKVENAEKHKSRKRDCSYDFELSAAPILLSDSERESLREEGHLVPTKAKVKPDDGYDVYVDASTQGNFTRFFNHSANPNCDQEYHWADFGKGPVLVVVYRARFDITGPCPVTIDYGKPYWKGQGFDPVELPWQDFKRMT